MRANKLGLLLGGLALVMFLGGSARADDSHHGTTIVHTKAETSTYADSDAVAVVSPGVEASIEDPLSGWSVTGTYMVDIVSAASVDIVSTASPHWSEVRHAATLSAKYKPHLFGGGVSAAISREPDYLSLSAGGNVSLELDDKNVVPLLGYSYTHNTAGRKTTPFSVYSHVYSTHTINGALELVLDPSTLVTFVSDVILERGNQSKPYRYVPLFAQDVAPSVPLGATGDLVNQLRLPGKIIENLPLSRNRFALTARLAQRLSASTFIVSERGYVDDWGQKASTTDMRFVVDVGKRFFLWPHLRLDVQSAVSFWKRAYIGQLGPGGLVNVPALRTGDRELGPLLTTTFGGGFRWNIGPSLRPADVGLVFLAEGAETNYRDALFIKNRLSGFSALELEATFQ